jgi:hypothetical protein
MGTATTTTTMRLNTPKPVHFFKGEFLIASGPPSCAVTIPTPPPGHAFNADSASIHVTTTIACIAQAQHIPLSWGMTCSRTRSRGPTIRGLSATSWRSGTHRNCGLFKATNPRGNKKPDQATDLHDKRQSEGGAIRDDRVMT